MKENNSDYATTEVVDQAWIPADGVVIGLMPSVVDQSLADVTAIPISADHNSEIDNPHRTRPAVEESVVVHHRSTQIELDAIRETMKKDLAAILASSVFFV